MKSLYYHCKTADILKSSAYKLSQKQQWGRKNIDYNTTVQIASLRDLQEKNLRKLGKKIQLQLQLKSMVFNHAIAHRNLTNYSKLFFGFYSHSLYSYQTEIQQLLLRMRQDRIRQHAFNIKYQKLSPSEMQFTKASLVIQLARLTHPRSHCDKLPG